MSKELASFEHFDTINIPSWSLSYLINSDASGLEDSEIELIDEWIDSLDYHSLVFDIVGDDEYLDPFFTSHPEFGLPCDCVECNLYGYKK